MPVSVCKCNAQENSVLHDNISWCAMGNTLETYGKAVFHAMICTVLQCHCYGFAV